MLEVIRKVHAILTKRERRQFAVLLVVIAFMGVFEMAGIAAIMPFMQLVSQPDAIDQSSWLQAAYTWGEFENSRSFLFALGVFVLVLLTTANTLTVFTLWMQYRFTSNSAHSVANRLLKKYLRQPYEVFLHQNTSVLAKQVLDESNQLAMGVMLPISIIVARIVVTSVIFALLVLVDPWLALTMFSVFGSVYSLLLFFTRKLLSRLGEQRFEANSLRYKTASESLAGIKLLKISGREHYFLSRFGKASRAFTRVEPKRQVAFAAPVYIVQTLAFGSILILILYLLATGKDMQEAIPLLALYALAGYRLLPSMSQLLKAFNDLRYQRPVLNSIFDSLKNGPESKIVLSADREQLSFYNEIALSNITYRYSGAQTNAISNLNLEIKKGERVAFVGTTGSGKTTLVDIIVGLISPSKGVIRIDGEPIDFNNTRSWQRKIGYVPQDVVLYDDSILCNIAYGREETQIDLERVQHAAQLASIHDFIHRELPEGYNTFVGERGIRLSGGQRQRIGLARALYEQPELLILDEATSALDGITEETVMQGIARTGNDLTIIMIAHRLATVKACDRIFLMEEGRIVAAGTYRELLETNVVFRGMAKVESEGEIPSYRSRTTKLVGATKDSAGICL